MVTFDVNPINNIKHNIECNQYGNKENIIASGLQQRKTFS